MAMQKECEAHYKKGNLSDYLGIKIERKPDGTLEWTQTTLTQSILKDLKLDGEEIKGKQNKPNIKPVPANTSVPLTDHRESPDHNSKDFEYRHVIGKLLYLEKSTRPDISCAVHQCARHCANPKIQHTAAVKRIGRYLLGTKNKGLIMIPNQEGMEFWIDAAHASEWNKNSIIRSKHSKIKDGLHHKGTKNKGLIMIPNQEGMECWVDAAHASEWNKNSIIRSKHSKIKDVLHNNLCRMFHALVIKDAN
jgi:hypothetical protein